MRRALGAAALAAFVGVAAVVPVSPAAASAAAPAPTDEFCAAFSDYYAAQFVLALMSGFAQIGEEGEVDTDALEAQIALALSPKLLEITRDMRRAAPRVLRSDLAEHVRIYQRAIELLRDAGVTPRAIRAIAAIDIQSDSGDFAIEDEIGISEQKWAAAGREFAEFAAPVLDWKPPRAAFAFLERAANECGIAPSTRVDCSELMHDDEVAVLIGESPTLSEGQGCVWETSENGGVDTNTLAIEVYDSGWPYERFTDEHETTERVPGLGDAAVTISGFETSGSFKSCGRTIVASEGDRTVLVALCFGDADELPIDEVRSIVEQVLNRL